MEAILALVGAAATALTWWLKNKQQDPLRQRIKHYQVLHQELLDKYARSVGRVKTLEKLVLKYKKELYEEMDGDELIAAWNRGLWDDDSDPEVN